MARGILIRGARQLLTLRGVSGPRRGTSLRDLGLVEDGSVLVINGRIASVGPTRRIENLAEAKSADEIDATGRVVMPAFVDSELWLMGAPARALEYPLNEDASRIRAADVAAATAMHVRNTSPARLEAEGRRLLDRCVRQGTVLLEGKTGFGLAEASETKLLRVVQSLRDGPADVVPALSACGTPAEFEGDRAEYVDWLCEEFVPRLQVRGLVSMIEIACDGGSFSLEHTMRLLSCARRLGIPAKTQADAAAHAGGVRLAIEFQARAVTGLNYCDAADASMLAASGTMATLLPGAVFHGVHAVYPPARMLIDAGAAVSLASGYHPTMPSTLNMQAVIGLACTQMRVTPEEAIAASTINGAYALQRGDSSGSLEFGKDANLIILDVPDYNEISYHWGMNLVHLSMRRGAVVHRESAAC